MSINFNRNRTQTYIEDLLSIDVYSTDKTVLRNNRQILEDHIFLSQEINDLKLLIKDDAKDYFYDGCISLFEGVSSIFHNKFSWATVKLYYSIFYFLRASLACKNFAIIRASGNHYYLHLVDDKRIDKIGSCNTHQAVINCYKTIYRTTDPLLTNNVDLNGVDYDTYSWLEEIRNITNYKQTAFPDPNCLSIWDSFNENEDRIRLFKNIVNDEHYTYCFQPEFGILSIPIERLKQTINDFKSCSYTSLLTNDRKDYLISLLEVDTEIISVLESIIY